MPYQPMTSAQEQLLVRAIDLMTTEIEGGLHPTDALVKASRAFDVAEGFIPVLGRAYNSARTIEQLRSEDQSNRAAACDLADSAAAVAQVYPRNVKSAREISLSETVSPEYQRTPSQVLGRGPLQKAAAAPTLRSSLPPADDITVAQRARWTHEYAKQAHFAAEMRLKRAWAELERVLKRTDKDRLRHVRKQAALAMDPAVVPMLDRLGVPSDSPTLRGAHPFHKQASPYRELAAVLDALVQIGELRQKQAYASDVAATANFVVQWPPPGRSVSDIVDGYGSVLDKVGSVVPALAGAAAGASSREMFGSLAEAFKGPDQEQQVASAIDKLSDPAHEHTLRDIQTRAVYADLLAHDPVISQHDPETVRTTFNELSQLAPRSVSQAAWLRGALRRALTQGSLDPYEVGDMTRTEAQFQRLEAPAQNINVSGGGQNG